ncbi:MAG: hypothetical protein ABJA98_21355 [Acidobacteriota bacterium]
MPINTVTRLFAPTVVALVLAGCAGGGLPASPIAPSTAGVLEGQWTGTFTTIVRDQAVVGPITVRFTTTPNSSGQVFRAELSTSNIWLPIVNTGDATTAYPGIPPTSFTLDQNYASPRGCRGDLHAIGQLETARHIDADIIGFENCPVLSYTGHLILDKQS